MFKNYFKSAWRNLVKNRFYTSINIAGLAVGLAVGIMILLWVQNELSYDSFHSNAKNIYKINSHLGSGKSAQVWDGSPAPLAIFAKSVPGVVNEVRIMGRNPLLFSNGNTKILETSSAYVDPSFFSIFSFQMIKGNTAKPFTDDHSIVITESSAKKYFGTVDAVGKILVNDKDNFTITAVIKDFPLNSSIQYNMLFPLSLYAKNFGGNGAWKTVDEDLGDYMYYVYLQLQSNTSSDVVAQKLSKIFTDKKGEDVKNNFFTLQSFSSLHLVAADGNSSALQTVKVFLIIAILIRFKIGKRV